MALPVRPASRGAAGLPEKEALTIRLVALLAVACILGFGGVYRVAMPAANDPWSYRFVVAAVCAALYILSYVPGRPGFVAVMHLTFATVTGWVVLLLALNDFAPEYALGLMVIVAVISMLFRGTVSLAVYGTVTLAAVGVVAARVSEPRMSPLLFGSYLVVILGLFWVVVRNRLRAEREIAASEERYALAALGANDGLWDWDVAAGTLYLSPRWREIAGASEDEASRGPEDWLGRIHPADRARVDAELFPPGGPGGTHFQSEHRIAHSDGSWRWVLVRGVRVVGPDGEIVRMVGSESDISERKRFEEQLVHDALHDSLTGLPNRALFLDRLERAIARTHRQPAFHFAVIFLDLDRFKVINDRVGHVAADGVLTVVARRLEQCLRHGDSVARLGGDEFALLVEDVDEPSLVAQRIQHALVAPIDAGGEPVVVTVSMGIAVSSTGFARPEDALRDADAAMYRAKARGRSRFEVADDELHAHSLAQVAMEGELRHATGRGELRLHYQPVVRLDTRELVGFEALMRWEHPTLGLCSPSDFIPLAEQTGIVTALERWALREGCRQMQAWRRSHPWMEELWLSVNLSTRHFLRPALAQEIQELLGETGFAPDRLHLEITESVIMDDPAAVGPLLHRLRASGVRVAIDDFGTGYSSLAYLHRLPLDTLKIDRSFVHQMRSDPALEAVIRTLLSLSEILHLETIAEGVETEEEASALLRMGCRYGQGFLFARPLPPADAERLLGATPGTPVTA
ncbi:MAG TPA: GGDEF and EAL domain-containing protein [Longimicrobium sp.]|jgi:diguanylate cyclase (GGDEF)-like protein/PAS domain S-box-containing protein